MNRLYEEVQETIAHIRSRTDFLPNVGIVLGSGLGPLASETAGKTIDQGVVRRTMTTLPIRTATASEEDPAIAVVVVHAETRPLFEYRIS